MTTKDIFKTLIQVDSEDDMLNLAAEFSSYLKPGHTIYLNGDLGAGKTVFARGLLHAMGVRDNVTSPTFSLVETYTMDKVVFHHFDLYRIEDPFELELMGIRDYFSQNAIVAIEWPEKAAGQIAKADFTVNININHKIRMVEINNETV